MNDQAKRLANHLYEVVGDGCGNVTARTLALAILADPQAHIDALVEAGALYADRLSWTDQVGYYVSAAHTHAYDYIAQIVDGLGGPRTILVLRCSCGNTTRVPNAVPVVDPLRS